MELSTLFSTKFKKMRVLNVNAIIDPISGGGTAERTLAMSRHLGAHGVACTILTTDCGLTGKPIDALKGLDIIALPCINMRFYIPWFSLTRIKNIVRQADVVHLMGHWTFINALVYLFTRRFGKAYVVCIAGSIPIIGRSKFFKRFYNLLIGNRIIRNANGCIAIAPGEKQVYQSYGVGAEKIVLIPNAIEESTATNTNCDDFRKKNRLSDIPYILFVGRLNYVKGPDLLICAFAEVVKLFPEFHLVMAGPDDGMLADLKRLVREKKLTKNVHFIGYVGGTDKSSTYRAAELLVIPSRQEAMSIVVLESGISGTPVLLTDQCGFDEVAGIGGGKVVPATVEGVQAGLVEMLSNRTRLADKGKKLMEYVRDNYTWNVMVRRYLDLYEKLLARP